MKNIPSTLSEQLQPSQTALVIVDMQNDFCAEGGYLHRTRAESGRNPIRVDSNARIADRIGELAQAARRAGATVAWLRSVYDFKYLADAHIAMREGEGCCMEGTWGADFFRIQPEPGDVLADKHTFSGFHETTLHAQLQARGIRTLVLTGVATNVCVDSTLRHGFFLGYHIVVLEDCVGSGNPTGHEGTLSTVRVNFGSVISSAEFLQVLGEHAPALQAL
ncbi:Peroxyureidoacrylate/ureidoacrylate amidohydrolase RutB [Pigmentiphaga humi]|uniref:Peroxyureidoacrylate/ureidoacrylate amidohydrolase RutB n=1 Tax=Pigmentiphaga humi TaxID=2478468 RepID=A0A3P4AZ10_9BURK|nr:cysteine hydrolase [Pigmentiphaga humi]VCU68638.1 Peroxyureidoacrylate/ureidoacrylate amidohydrolase RutB [Pigmentiphaga humi]